MRDDPAARRAGREEGPENRARGEAGSDPGGPRSDALIREVMGEDRPASGGHDSGHGAARRDGRQARSPPDGPMAGGFNREPPGTEARVCTRAEVR
ncbi:hypothetical protein GCM10010498_62200 [Streptomyces cavourensis]|nr:hypothetical protein GCM10010498_62200 [Streptomyces cavourensis]